MFLLRDACFAFDSCLPTFNGRNGLDLQFLIRNNKSDLLILKQTKDAIRVSVCHTATVIANALMHSGTTSDQFLRDNLDWSVLASIFYLSTSRCEWRLMASYLLFSLVI